MLLCPNCLSGSQWNNRSVWSQQGSWRSKNTSSSQKNIIFTMTTFLFWTDQKMNSCFASVTQGFNAALLFVKASVAFILAPSDSNQLLWISIKLDCIPCFWMMNDGFTWLWFSTEAISTDQNIIFYITLIMLYIMKPPCMEAYFCHKRPNHNYEVKKSNIVIIEIKSENHD